MNKIDEVLTRGVDSILPSKNELLKLMLGKKITLYQGFDPSMPSLHLGNLVGLIKLRQFQKLGHKVIFLIGDFTGMIGDPTDKLATRNKLSRSEVLANAKNYKNQAAKILEFSGQNPAEIKFNSEWNDKLSFRDLIEITSNFTVQQMIERDMFQQRIKNLKPIYLHEFLYPVAQGYDSYSMNVDLEVGGSDQIFNMLAGRTLVKALKNKEKYVLATKLLVDKNGKKVGKTTGNALFLDSDPNEFFAGIMSFPDEVIKLGYELLTEINLDGLEEKIIQDPLGQKKQLAFEIVKSLWGIDKATAANEYFKNTFQKKLTPSKTLKIITHNKINITDAVVMALKISKSEIKRLLKNKAIDINGKTITDPNFLLRGGENVKVGKKIFFKIGRNGT